MINSRVVKRIFKKQKQQQQKKPQKQQETTSIQSVNKQPNHSHLL